MALELHVEGRRPAANPSPAQIASSLRGLNVDGATFVLLQRASQDYLQAGGTEAGCMIEWRKYEVHRRGRQDPPVVPYEDGTEITVGDGRIRLLRSEWFSVDQTLEVLLAYAAGRPFPAYVKWHDI